MRRYRKYVLTDCMRVFEGGTSSLMHEGTIVELPLRPYKGKAEAVNAEAVELLKRKKKRSKLR